MDGWDEPFEPRIARDVAGWIPDGGRLFVGNSTPIRDLDLAMRPRRNLTVMGNRGASGIDGLVSTALGISVARPGPVVALVGDLSFLHDAGAVLWNATREVDLTVVVVDNGGGHVFSLLPQRELPEHRELFVTPHAVDIGGVCAAAGAGYQRVERASDLLPALDRAAGVGRGIQVIDVIVDAELGLRRRAELRRGRRRRPRGSVSEPQPSIGFAASDDVAALARLRFALYVEQDGEGAEPPERLSRALRALRGARARVGRLAGLGRPDRRRARRRDVAAHRPPRSPSRGRARDRSGT